MSESIKFEGKHGILVRQTAARLYVVLEEPKIHIRKLPIAALGDIEFTPRQPLDQIKRHLRQAARGQHITAECQLAIGR